MKRLIYYINNDCLYLVPSPQTSNICVKFKRILCWYPSPAEAEASIAGGPELYIQVGSSVHLQCVIEKYTEPPTYVFWYQDTKMVNYDTRRQVLELLSKRSNLLLFIPQTSIESLSILWNEIIVQNRNYHVFK